MTENLAGRGEGLRERIIAAMKRAWPKTKVCSYNGVILELEKLCREIALEAAAPAGTAPRELNSLLDEGAHRMADLLTEHSAAERKRRPFLTMCQNWVDAARAALATPSPQAPPDNQEGAGWSEQEQSNAFSTTSAREQSSATASSNLSAADADTMKVLRFLVKHEMGIDKFYFDVEGKVVISENCNDLFYWACADAEDVTPADLPLLEQTVKDCEAIKSSYAAYAGTVWACRKRGMRPQNPCYVSYPKDLWPLFDAAGPERPEKEAGSRQRAEEKYEAKQKMKICEHCQGRGRA